MFEVGYFKATAGFMLLKTFDDKFDALEYADQMYHTIPTLRKLNLMKGVVCVMTINTSTKEVIQYGSN